MNKLKRRFENAKWRIIDIKCSDWNTFDDCEYHIGTVKPTMQGNMEVIVRTYFSQEEANKAIEEHNKIIDYGYKIETDKNNSRLSLRLPYKYRKILEFLAEKNNKTLSSYVFEIIDNHLKEK